MNRGTLIAIAAIALLAISSLVAGGLLLHFELNTTAAWSLLGGGGGILILDALIGGIVLYIRRQKVEDRPPSVDKKGVLPEHMEKLHAENLKNVERMVEGEKQQLETANQSLRFEQEKLEVQGAKLEKVKAKLTKVEAELKAKLNSDKT